MSDPPRYLLDSNVFIEAARRYYAFDLVPQFWDILIAQAKAGRLHSIDRVRAELDRGKDGLAKWAKQEFAQWFASTGDPDVIHAYGQIMVWSQEQGQFMKAAKAEFARADNADSWVVAYAHAKGLVITTHEQFDPNVKNRVPIPNVSQALGLRWVDTFQMLRELGVKLG